MEEKKRKKMSPILPISMDSRPGTPSEEPINKNTLHLLLLLLHAIP
jgi:hypothetical protein